MYSFHMTDENLTSQVRTSTILDAGWLEAQIKMAIIVMITTIDLSGCNKYHLSIGTVL